MERSSQSALPSIHVSEQSPQLAKFRRLQNNDSSVFTSTDQAGDMLSTFESSYGNRTGTVTKIDNIYNAKRFLNQDMELIKSNTLPVLSFVKFGREKPMTSLKVSSIMLGIPEGVESGSIYKKDFESRSYPRPFIYPPIKDSGVIQPNHTGNTNLSSTRMTFVNYQNIHSMKAENDQAAIQNSLKFGGLSGNPHTYGSSESPIQSTNACDYDIKPLKPALKVVFPKTNFLNHSYGGENMSESSTKFRTPMSSSLEVLSSRKESFDLAKKRIEDNHHSHFSFGSDTDDWKSIRPSVNRQVKELYRMPMPVVNKFVGAKVSLRNSPTKMDFYRMRSVMHSDFINPQQTAAKMLRL